MRSHLLVGRVAHRRFRNPAYALEHRVWQLGLDLDELDLLDRRLRLLSRNRRNLVEIRDADHLPEPSRDLARDVRALLAGIGLNGTNLSIVLVANPRVLGYVFNPASFFLCRDEAGVLRRVIVEVHNTFGERHLYPLRPGHDAEPMTQDEAFRAGMPKAFFVSPFISIDGSYAVHVRDDAAGTRIAIALRQAEGPMLSTSLVLERRRLNDRNLLRLLLRYPLMTQRTIGLIHWHAIRLWLRGAPFFRHGQARRAAGGASAHGVAHLPGPSR